MGVVAQTHLGEFFVMTNAKISLVEIKKKEK
jgi:hypothetical protein